MPLTLICINGHQTQVADVFAARPAICGVCGAIVRPGRVETSQVASGVARRRSLDETTVEPLALLPISDSSPADTQVDEQSARRESTSEPPKMLPDTILLPVAPPDEIGPARAEPRVKRRRSAPTEFIEESVESDPGNDAPLPMEPGFRLAYRGLGFHYAQAACQLFGALLLAVSIGVGLLLLFGTPGWVTPIFEGVWLASLLIVAALYLIAPVLGLIGSVLCLRVPRQVRARPFNLASFLVGLFPVPMATGGYVMAYLGQDQMQENLGQMNLTPATILMSASILLTVVAWILFLLFVRRLGDHFRELMIADESVALVLRIGALVFGWIAAGGVSALSAFFYQQRSSPSDLSLSIGIGIIAAILVPLILWATVSLWWRLLALIGSIRHVILARAD